MKRRHLIWAVVVLVVWANPQGSMSWAASTLESLIAWLIPALTKAFDLVIQALTQAVTQFSA